MIYALMLTIVFKQVLLLEKSVELNSTSYMICNSTISNLHSPVYQNCIPGLCLRLLLLSGDVEENPGPVSDDSETRILSAISALEYRFIEQFNIFQAELTEVTSEVKSIKREVANLRNESAQLNKAQSQLQSDVNATRSDVEYIHGLQETLQLDVDTIGYENDCNKEKINKLEEKIEFLERDKIKGNIRVFGLPGDEMETVESLKSEIIKKVLKVACPSENWASDDIKFAKRIGNKDGIVLVGLRYDDDKFKIYRGRNVLRSAGIRVGDDLTKSQRSQLWSLNQSGKRGYYYKGKLVVEEKKSEEINVAGVENKGARVFKRATRQTMDIEHDVIPEDINFNKQTVEYSDKNENSENGNGAKPISSYIDIDNYNSSMV
jgi:hypothetical protein